MSTVIVITPPPKNPQMTAEDYAKHMQEKAARLERDMNALREAGFTVTVEQKQKEPEKKFK
jgi:hypothetical protein